MGIRIGFGYDTHRLVEDRPLVLGGVTIPHEKGLLGHSDADVLTHAIIDALLGAAGLRDIGHHFPDTDAAYKGIDSMDLLSRTAELLEKYAWEIVNIDCTVVAEAPKINPHVPQMIQTLSDKLFILKDQINIKATRNEQMGPVGRQEGMVAYAVALIQQ